MNTQGCISYILTEDANCYSGLKPMCVYVLIPPECAYSENSKILELFTMAVFILQVPSVTKLLFGVIHKIRCLSHCFKS